MFMKDHTTTTAMANATLVLPIREAGTSPIGSTAPCFQPRQSSFVKGLAAALCG